MLYISSCFPGAIAAMRLRCSPEGENTKTANVVAVGRGSTLSHFHATTGKLMHECSEGENEIFALDFRWGCGTENAE